VLALQPHSFGAEAMRRSVSDKECYSKLLKFLLREQKKGMLTKLNECKSRNIEHKFRGC
jgi:hypothetical protein